MVLKEYNITTSDNLKLYSQIWHTEITPKAMIAIVHGLGEHSGRYRELAQFLNKQGFSVAGLDLRGHGLSEGPRGHAASYDLLMSDIGLYIDMLKKLNPKLPSILMGHSFGGNLVLTYLLKIKPTLAGAIITSPLLALPDGQNIFKKLIGNILYHLTPAFTIATGLDAAALSRDIQVGKTYQEDPLVHDRVSVKLGVDFLRYGDWVQSQSLSNHMPVLVMQGSSDRIVDPEAVRRFCQSQNGKLTYREWKGFYHELHNEPQKMDVYQEISQWVAQSLNPVNKDDLLDLDTMED